MTLYELTDAYKKLQEYADVVADDPAAEAQRQELLDTVEDQLEAKLAGIARVLRNYDAETTALREEEKRLAAKRKARENAAAWLKRYAKQEMERAGVREASDGVLKIAIQRNPPSLALDCPEEMVPEEYKVPRAPKVDKKGILADLKAGVALEWAHIEQSESVRVR